MNLTNKTLLEILEELKELNNEMKSLNKEFKIRFG